MLLSLGANSQTFLSVSDLLSIRASFVKNDNNWQNIVKKRGYDKYRQIDGELYLYKNCRLVTKDDDPYQSDGQTVEADTKTANASIFHIYKDVFNWHEYLHFEVIVYGKANGQKWITQLHSLGYMKNNGASWSGFGRTDLYYEKRGYPDITIINQGTTYRLETMIQGDYVTD